MQVFETDGNPSGIDRFGQEFDRNVDLTVDEDIPQEEPKARRDDEDNKKGGFTNWTVLGGGRYTACTETINKLQAGVYSPYTNCKGEIVYQTQVLNSDELIAEGNTQMNDLLSEIRFFWDLENTYKKYGFLHSRGVMLHGKQGCGKSALVNLISREAVKKDSLVLLCNSHPDMTLRALKELREVEGKRNIICIYEDIEAIVGTEDRENTLLSILDGEVQLNNILNIATTNYPEKLDPRIISRPRRFDKIIEIHPPEYELRYKYFQEKFNGSMTDEECEVFANQTDGLTFASLAECVISVKCLGYGLEETIERLRQMENKENKVGFGY